MQFNPSALGLWIFLAAGSIALFTMIAVASWPAERRKEREAYYWYELIKRIAEQAGAGGQTALEAFREEEKTSQLREQRRLLVSGPVTMGAGVGLMLFFAAIAREPVWLIGAIPFFVGLATLICGLAFRPPLPERRRAGRAPSEPLTAESS